jgi:hypothetical protein
MNTLAVKERPGPQVTGLAPLMRNVAPAAKGAIVESEMGAFATTTMVPEPPIVGPMSTLAPSVVILKESVDAVKLIDA